MSIKQLKTTLIAVIGHKHISIRKLKSKFIIKFINVPTELKDETIYAVMNHPILNNISFTLSFTFKDGSIARGGFIH